MTAPTPLPVRQAATLLVLAVMLAGCASTPTRFWTIEAVPAPAPLASLHRPAPIQIAAVHVPLAIDRLEVVRHHAAQRVQVLDFDRWSAPPGNLMRRALTQDLIARRPAGTVVFPDAPAPPDTRVIAVDVLDVSQGDGQLTMQVSWTITGPAPRPTSLRLTVPMPTADVAGQTASLGTAIARLADDIASKTE